MTISHFSSADSGAPVLNNAAGCLKSLLKKCLIGTAGIAYGTTPSQPGWSIVAEATNSIAFKSTDPNATGIIFQIKDDGTQTTSSEAHLTSWETLTGIDTGTNRSPTVAELANGCNIRHANQSSNSTGVFSWDIVCDSRTVYIFIDWYDPVATTEIYQESSGFGDFNSFVGGGDPYGAFVYGRMTGNDATNTGSMLGPENYWFYAACTTGTFHTYTGMKGAPRLARNYLGNAVSMPFGVMGMGAGSPPSTSVNSNMTLLPFTYPSLASNGGLFTPVYITEIMSGTENFRGIFRGLYLLQGGPIPNATAQFSPPPPASMPGRAFWRTRLMNNNGAGQRNQGWLDVTGPW